MILVQFTCATASVRQLVTKGKTNKNSVSERLGLYFLAFFRLGMKDIPHVG